MSTNSPNKIGSICEIFTVTKYTGIRITGSRYEVLDYDKLDGLHQCEGTIHTEYVTKFISSNKVFLLEFHIKLIFLSVRKLQGAPKAMHGR